MRSRAVAHATFGAKRRTEMYRRLGFSIALIVILFCFWLLAMKPICRDGFTASFGARSGWTCAANDN
jgi:hypothetical protein